MVSAMAKTKRAPPNAQQARIRSIKATYFVSQEYKAIGGRAVRCRGLVSPLVRRPILVLSPHRRAKYWRPRREAIFCICRTRVLMYCRKGNSWRPRGIVASRTRAGVGANAPRRAKRSGRTAAGWGGGEDTYRPRSSNERPGGRGGGADTHRFRRSNERRRFAAAHSIGTARPIGDTGRRVAGADVKRARSVRRIETPS